MGAGYSESKMAAKTLQHTRRGLKMVGNKSLFDLDEPQWIPDDSVTTCQKCLQAFTMFNRRHHCRRCGRIYCGNCCSDFLLHRMGFVDPVKVCVECLPKCKSEDQFYKNQLKCLTKGSKFLLSGSSASKEVVHCCLSADHYYIEFKPEQEMVRMKEINEVNTGTGEDKVMTLRVKHKDRELLFTPSRETRKEGTEWLKALKKALLVLHNKAGSPLPQM